MVRHLDNGPIFEWSNASSESNSIFILPFHISHLLTRRKYRYNYKIATRKVLFPPCYDILLTLISAYYKYPHDAILRCRSALNHFIFTMCCFMMLKTHCIQRMNSLLSIKVWVEHVKTDVPERLFTQLNILFSGPLGKRQVLVKGLQYFLLHLTDSVGVHHTHAHRVHPETLERYVNVLEHRQKRSEVKSRLIKSQRSHLHECDFKSDAHLWFGFDVFSEEPLLVERVTRLPRDGVNRALVDLLFDGAQQQEERLTDRLLMVAERNNCSPMQVKPPSPEKPLGEWNSAALVYWRTNLKVAVHADGHPVGEHLLHYWLCSPQHQFRVFAGWSVNQIN